ncbi:MAG: hypothetical protein ACYCTY_09290 [Sulfuricella sp.]
MRKAVAFAPPTGILIRGSCAEANGFQARLDALGLAPYTAMTVLSGRTGAIFHLKEVSAQDLSPGADTTLLCERLHLDTVGITDDLEREILLALMASPVRHEFRSYEELASAVRIRKNIVIAARKTMLAFDTSEAAERPGDCWGYSKGRGFTVLPGESLIDALRKATQPDVSGKLYTFSCYRATEYVILLGIAEELATYNPALLARLQRQWETRAIMSREFHEVFMIEYGSMDSPLPPKYYVPGDRLWFRNPDGTSSDITGYEGSWVFYLGGGLFTNFWKHNQPYTLTSKCLEIYHWRNGAYRDADGELRMNESTVDALVKVSLRDPKEVDKILRLMMRWREPQGIYVAGGCIDTSREHPRAICPSAPDLVLPDGGNFL